MVGCSICCRPVKCHTQQHMPDGSLCRRSTLCPDIPFLQHPTQTHPMPLQRSTPFIWTQAGVAENGHSNRRQTSSRWVAAVTRKHYHGFAKQHTSSPEVCVQQVLEQTSLSYTLSCATDTSLLHCILSQINWSLSSQQSSRTAPGRTSYTEQHKERRQGDTGLLSQLELFISEKELIWLYLLFPSMYFPKSCQNFTSLRPPPFCQNHLKLSNSFKSR